MQSTKAQIEKYILNVVPTAYLLPLLRTHRVAEDFHNERAPTSRVYI